MTDRREVETTAERRLRAGLEPDGEALDRVVRRALEAGRAEGPDRAGSGRNPRRSPLGRLRPRRILVPLAAGLTAVAALAALLLVGSPEPTEPPGPSASVTHRDGVLIVRRLDGGTSLLDARAGQPAASRGATMILKKGERP